MFILLIITVYSLIAFQVRVDLGLLNHKKRAVLAAVIAQTVDDLGDQFRPAMRTRWLAYIKKAYGEVAPAAASFEDQGTLVVA
jgi:hypothetical protein